jgi:hypothetical protein
MSIPPDSPGHDKPAPEGLVGIPVLSAGLLSVRFCSVTLNQGCWLRKTILRMFVWPLLL